MVLPLRYLRIVVSCILIRDNARRAATTGMARSSAWRWGWVRWETECGRVLVDPGLASPERTRTFALMEGQPTTCQGTTFGIYTTRPG